MEKSVTTLKKRIKSWSENFGWRIFTPFLPRYFTGKHFEELYQSKPDPWNYQQNLFEKEKYQKTLDAVPHDTSSIWEVGCSEGVFTRLLLEKGKTVYGVDISETALQRATERLKAYGERFQARKLDITREDGRGTFDLILTSEILYYLGGRNVLLSLEEKFWRHLRPGGYLLMCHFYPSGKIIHDLYQESGRFQLISESVTHHPEREYIITLLRRG
ncbi:MAG: class I SAM-dependent methyltransferase [Atribacterota bacterium]